MNFYKKVLDKISKTHYNNLVNNDKTNNKPIENIIMNNIITPSVLVRNTGVNVLSSEEIAHVAPSAFSRSFSELRTEQYSMFNTADIIDALAKEGFVPTKAFQHNPKHSPKFIQARQDRMEADRLHQRHLIRFTHVDHLNNPEERPEIVLVNSHNGACSYQLAAGIFRLVCSNGLIVRTQDFGTVSIRHEGHSLDEVINASMGIASRFNELFPIVEDMKNIHLTPGEVTMFAMNAARIKYGDKKFENVRQIVEPLRKEDAENTLWNVYNRAQENIIRGGKKITSRTMQPILRIEEGIRVNADLFEMANNWRMKRVAA